MDYIALHIYMGQSPQTYSNQVKKIFSTYGKKIWITEFAPRDDSATSGQPETNKVSEEWIRNNFIEPVLTDYENMDEVFRYKLTSLGDYYATIHPNDDAPANGMTMPQ